MTIGTVDADNLDLRANAPLPAQPQLWELSMFKHKPLNFKFMTGVAAATIGAFILVPIATSIDATSLLGIDAAKAGQGSGGGSVVAVPAVALVAVVLVVAVPVVALAAAVPVAAIVTAGPVRAMKTAVTKTARSKKARARRAAWAQSVALLKRARRPAVAPLTRARRAAAVEGKGWSSSAKAGKSFRAPVSSAGG